MNDNVLERRLAHEMDAGHHHSGDPEEDDILRRHQIGRRIVVFEILRLLRPAESRERPEPGAEPGIKNILVLHKICCGERGVAGLGLRHLQRFLGALGDEHRLFVNAAVDGAQIVCRNPVPPPELTGNTPVLNVFHPVEIDFRPALGDELHFAGLDRFNGGFGERLHLHEPLL